MPKKSDIQWCDTTVNPVMGCRPCELFPNPNYVMEMIDMVLIRSGIESWYAGRAREMLELELEVAWDQLIEEIGTPGEGHKKSLSLTNIWHLRKRFETSVADEHGKAAGALACSVIEQKVVCYAARLHLNKGYSIINPTRTPNSGYAPTFEQVKPFAGRIQVAAKYSDLLGESREGEPWLNGLPRIIFVSDMGDAFSRKADFAHLQNEVESMRTDAGIRHIYLWLTKRPENMAEFAESIGGMPANVCAMTSVTNHDVLYRVDQLREVRAQSRGLSLEPQWSDISGDIDLNGIDWVIVGGQSGARATVTPFPIEWAHRMLARCREQGVAFFCKQLGSRPTRGGTDVQLKDRHGGDWSEWDESLRVRDFPAYFHAYLREDAHDVEVAAPPAANVAN